MRLFRSIVETELRNSTRYDGFRRIRELVGPSKGEAKSLLAKRRAERSRGRQGIVPIVTAPPFDQFVEGKYTEYAKTNKRGFYNEQYRLKQLTRLFGKRPLSEFNRWDGEQLKIEMNRHVAPATVNRLLGNLKRIFSLAVDNNIIPANPIARVKLLKVPKRTERILTREEGYQLLAACSQVHAPLLRASVLIGLNTGMRKGEIHRLKWEHVDLPNRLITIYNGKTSESDRPIPMNTVVYELLSSLWQQRKGEFVFPSPRKKGERFRDPKVGFLKAVRLAKIPHIRFHDLRQHADSPIMPTAP